MARRFAMLLFLLCIVGGGMSAATAADPTNEPVGARPATNAVLPSQPDAVTVVFLKEAKGPAYVVVEDAHGKDIAVGTPRLVSTNLAIQLGPDVPNGVYTVKFRIQGTSGPEGGSYQFAIGGGDFTIKGFDHWGGYSEIPKSLALPGDAASAAAEATPTPTPDDASATPDSDTNGSDAPNSSSDDDGLPWWVWPLGALGLGAVGAVVIAVRRRTRTPEGS